MRDCFSLKKKKHKQTQLLQLNHLGHTPTFKQMENNDHQKCLCFNPQICKYVNLHGKKKTLQVLLRLRVLRWGDQPGLSKWAQFNHKDSFKKETGGTESRVGDEMMDMKEGYVSVCFCVSGGKRVVEKEEKKER